ncbi:RNA methyltransferase [Bifidobacterium sp. ESL0800]|uniref:TrmH family RNA methyltransferase n=1 Tax=Bifidobacterium sp. ESL0800 TaxID=2983236 RepID=UPI0023FA03B0|nr:RNA methyltransferase [Bifidobacterium sp. ESL0800]WEV76250.1 RNA methyltransferase [Bifidobacterium sp. ESL0800]
MPFNQHIIDNPKAERVRRVTELEKTKGRKKSGKFLIEGPQSVREIVRWMPDVVEDCYVQMDERQSGLVSSVVEDIAREADEQGLYLHQVTGDVMHRMSTDAQGIVAVGDLDVIRKRMAEGFAGGEAGDLTNAEVVHNVATRRTEVRNSVSDNDETGKGTVNGNAETAAQRDTHSDVTSGRNQDSLGDSVAASHDIEHAGNMDSLGDTVAAFWQIRDPGNAGTVIRSADAAGCRAVIFVDDCVDRFNPKVIRSTAGSLFHLPVVTMSTEEFFAWAQSQGSEVMAADVYGTKKVKPESLIDVMAGLGQRCNGDLNGGGGRAAEATLVSDGDQDNDVRNDSGENNASNQTGQGSHTILFGNEARGLPADVLQRVQRIVSIPLYGKAESLNLATSTSVMLFTLAMARDAAKRQ